MDDLESGGGGGGVIINGPLANFEYVGGVYSTNGRGGGED